MPYFIRLYNEIPPADIDLPRILAYLEKHCSRARVEVRKSFTSCFPSPDLLAGLAGAWDIELSAERGFDYTEEERLDYEQRVSRKPETISPGVIYNGWKLLGLLQARIPRNESSLNNLHLILTPRLPVTKEMGDTRRHARTILCGRLSLISSSGLVEGPARPAEYYLLERAHLALGREIPAEEIQKRFPGRFLTHRDPRLTDVILGYILQAAAHRFFAEDFCGDPHCRLYNARRQREMLGAQLEGPEFCSRHRALFG